jgi:hypothetical protein
VFEKDKVVIFDGETAQQKIFETPAFQGIIDSFDPGRGISGWCANIDDPNISVELELLVNELVIERVSTDFVRSDVNKQLGLQGTFGFRFEAHTLDRLLTNRRLLDDRAFSIRIAETRMTLRQSEAAGSWSEWLEARAELLQQDDVHSVFEILQRLVEEATPLLALPSRLTSASEVGVIEMVARGAQGVTWFSGWIRRERIGDRAAFIIDHRKFRAGVVMASFARSDLPSEMAGIFGVLLSDWAPRQSADLVLRFSHDGDYYLRGVHHLRLVGVRDILAHVALADSNESRAAARRLTAFSESNDGWEVGSKAATAIRLAVDSAAGLEGFGVFLKGWIFSPSRAVKSLTLRLGDRQYPCHAESLYFSARPDLKSAFPNGRDALDRAGFCCIFDCQVGSSEYADIGLKILYDDGSLSHHQLPELVISKITPKGDGGHFKDYYPSMERQALFRKYAEAYYQRFSELHSAFSVAAAQRTDTQFIFAAPSERHSLYRLFEDLAYELVGFRGANLGVTIMASASAQHGEIHDLFDDFQASFTGKANLVFVMDSSHALWPLDELLTMLAVKRFIFVAGNVVINERGWDAVRKTLAENPHLAFFEIENPVEPWTTPDRSMAAFAWTSEGFVNWRRTRSLPIGAAPSAQTTEPDAVIFKNCGLKLADSSVISAVTRINALVGASV